MNRRNYLWHVGGGGVKEAKTTECEIKEQRISTLAFKFRP